MLEETEKIYRAFSHLSFFKLQQVEQGKKVCDCLKLVQYHSGTTLQIDKPAGWFYIVIAGSVSLQYHSHSTSAQPRFCRLREGASFGQYSLHYQCHNKRTHARFLKKSFSARSILNKSIAQATGLSSVVAQAVAQSAKDITKGIQNQLALQKIIHRPMRIQLNYSNNLAN